MKSEYFKNIIPKIQYKEYQNYIINFFNCAYAELITKNLNEVIDFLNNNGQCFDILEVKVERNLNGLDDYRIIIR